MRFHPPRHVYRPVKTVATEVRATVRWFDLERGFGFVSPEGGAAEAFLPAALVEAAGRRSLPEGVTLTVDLAEGERGPQVSRIYKFDFSTAVAEPAAGRGRGDRGDRGGAGPRREPRGPAKERGRPQKTQDRRGPPAGRADTGAAKGAAEGATEGTVEGTVKWYDEKKGFGFVGVEDGGRDVFVHATALERSGVGPLAEGEKVVVKLRAGEKGREAVEVRKG
ncbi:cold-shock protein [Arenibaculum sp.]|uniref:cold-shock protein n=1 Tax=Arenibaculum sp. TaxID=2865862 RepID=UPI002E12D9CF|nr:cold shock domain-containing protein [Arenibaculum sp.]